MKTFASLPLHQREKINNFHSLHYDLNILDAAVKLLMTNPNPDFICYLASKFSDFIDTEVLPLVERHDVDMKHADNAFEGLYKLHNNCDNYETENTENTENCLGDN